MKISGTLKNFLIFSGFGISALAFLIGIYSECSWGGCSSIAAPITIVVILSVISLVYLIIWLREIIKLTFKKKKIGGLEYSDENNKKGILLSIISIVLAASAISIILFMAYITWNEKVYYLLILLGFLALFIIMGAIGVWLYRKWGAFISITILSIISAPILLIIITKNQMIYSIPFIMNIIFIIVLVKEFKKMK